MVENKHYHEVKLKKVRFIFLKHQIGDYINNFTHQLISEVESVRNSCIVLQKWILNVKLIKNRDREVRGQDKASIIVQPLG